MPHRNIPIFIPHLGCPHQCVFCNQHSISGQKSFRESDVKNQIEKALSTISSDEKPQIAFFGGSFTGIDRRLMIRLLDLATFYVNAGSVDSIRLSTRPDFIDREIVEILSAYPVRSIELGIQSMDDSVLLASRRGHTSKQSADACRLVKGAGFELVGQMMIGLPGSTKETEMQTAERICLLGADAARIYPTVVFRGTPLCEMAQNGSYTPLTLTDAVARSAAALQIFLGRGVNCLRVGLCASETLTSEESVFAGPNHPALGELVWSEIYYQNILSLLQASDLLGKDVTLYVPRGEISKAMGQHRSNPKRLEAESGTRVCAVRETDGEMHVEPYQTTKENKRLCI